MKRFIKINTLDNIGGSRVAIINTQMIQSIAKSPFDFWIVAMVGDDEVYKIDQYTYEAIVAHLADEVTDLTPPNKDTMKLFDIAETNQQR